MIDHQVTSLSNLHNFEEIFIGVGLLYLITYGTLINHTLKNTYFRFNTSFLSLVVLVLLLGGSLSTIGDEPCLSFQSINFSNGLLVDSLSQNVKFLITVFSILFLILIRDYTSFTKINSFEYFTLFLFSILGLLLLCTCNDFLTMFLALELQSLAFYVLAAIKKQSSFSVESGLKYFVVGSFASGFFLFGVSLIYGILGTINFTEINELNLSAFFFAFEDIGTFLVLEKDSPFHLTQDAVTQNRLIAYVHVGFFFIFISLFIKMSIAPFHIWSPDVYENSPTSSSFFFIVLPKLSIFLALIKLCYYSSFGSLIWLKDWVFTLILLSVAFGALGGFEQRKLKSLLSYSSVSHSGYLLMSLVFESFESLFSLLAYLVIYTSSGICIWGLLLLLRIKKPVVKKHNKDLSDLTLLVRSNTILCFIFSGALFSLSGLPPLFGFLVKLNILFLAVQHNYFLIAGLSLFFSVLSLSYYLRIVKVLVFEPVLVGKLYEPIYSRSIMIPIIMFMFNIFLFICPSFFYKAVYKITLLFFFA